MDIFEALSPEQQELADRLSHKELTFANLWLTSEHTGMGRAECYEAAGYKVKNRNVAYVEARRILHKPKIWEYCRAMRAHSMDQTGLTLNYLDETLKAIIDGTAVEVMPVTKHVTEDGKEYFAPSLVCESADLPEEVQGAIQSIKMGPSGAEVKMYSRLEALKLAYQRQGALREGRELTGPGGSPLDAPLFQYQIIGSPGSEPPLTAAEPQEGEE